MDPLVVLPAIVVIGLVMVVIPVIAATAWAARSARPVTCPQTGGLVEVRIAPGRAVLGLVAQARQHVVACDLWPRASCDHGCELAIVI